MALRDFDRVQERMELHVERRHVALVAVGASALLGVAFWAGWRVASHQAAGPQVVATAPTAPATTLAPPPLPAPTAAHMADRPPPVLPTPVAAAARDRELQRRRRVARAPLAPMLEDVARNAGKAAVAADEVTEAPETAEAEADAEHGAPSDAPRSMLGRLPVPAVVRRGRSTKGAALAEAFGDAAKAPASSLSAGVPAEWVQSLPPRPDALSEDLSVTGRSTVAALGVALPLSPSGAALHTPMRAGGLTLDRPQRSVAPVRERARRQLVDELDAAEARERARVAAEARAKAEAEAQAKRLAAAREAERVAKLEAAKAALAAKAEAQRAAAKAEAQRAAAKAQAQRAAAKAALAAKAEAKRAAANKALAEREAAAKDTALAPPSRPAKTTAKRAQGRVYWVQLKSLRDGKEAKVFAQAMRAKGYKVRVHRAEVPKMGSFHRVRMGPYPTQAKAKAVEQRFRKREAMEAMVMSAPSL